MPTAGVLVAAAVVAIGYLYVAKPIAHGVKKASHGIVHVITLGKK